MRSRMIFFVAGVALATLHHELIPLFGCISIALAIIGLCFYKVSKYSSLISVLLLGFLYTTLWGHWQLTHRLPEELIRTDWRVSGEVVGLPQTKSRTTRFVLDVSQFEAIEGSVKVDTEAKAAFRKIRLSWFNPSEEIRSGNHFEGVVRLKPPHGLMNPSGFDYERWLLVRGIDATGYIREITAISSGSGLTLSELRQGINSQIHSDHDSEKVRAFLTAVITGEKQLLNDKNWEVLRVSGTVHLAVISGLHIGFIAFVGWWLGRFFAFTFGGEIQRVLPFVTAVFLSGFYMFIAGAELPAQRAFIMVSVLLISGWKLFHISHWTRWWMAMTAVLIYSPLAILETGFWLSFGAVACLIWCGQAYQFRWQDAVKLQFLLLVGMLPLYLFFFSGFSLIAPLVNMVAIPLVSVIVPIEFFNLILNGVLTPVVDALVLFFWWLVEQCSEFSWAFVEVQELELVALIMLLLASLILLLPSGFIPKSFALFLAMPVLFGVENETDDHFQAWIFDVGQGLAILIEQKDYRLLYDTGPSYRTGGNAFDRAVLPYLESKGIKHIDHVVLSHDDNDHVGGFGQLAEGFSLGKVTTSFDSDFSNNRCLEGDRWSIGGVNFRFLSGGEGSEDNDRSCVLLVESEYCSLLLPGDISATVEERLPIEKDVTWLVASHHGSKSSTSQAFLNKISPNVIIYSAGYGNPFNHPHPEVVERSKRADANLYSTAVNGAILLRSTKHLGCESSAFRSNKKRFWRSFQSL